MRSFSIVLLIALLFIFSHNICAQKVLTSTISPKELQIGEELTYVVSYSFIKLGEVKLSVKDKKVINGKPYYSTIAYIDSYEGIPFVNLHQIYESNISKSLYSHYFRGIVKNEEYSTYTIYSFDYNKARISVKKGKVYPAEVWTDSLAKADTVYQDGLSIFYFARMNLGSSRVLNIPCFVNEQKVYTKINFKTDIEAINIEAVDYDIECIKLEGETDFVSVFGLTGFFEGWFSNDSASIPIVAKMKVLIGNITLELKEWKRDGWIPPKYKG